MSDHDVIIIGGGPGGYLAAERLGHAGMRVLLAEADTVGGTCLNVGCIPTKSLLHSAKTYRHALDGAKFGVNVTGVQADWSAMQAWKAKTVGTLVGGVQANLRRLGVTIVHEHARVVGAGRVEVAGSVHKADHVIVATGSEPVMPPIPGTDGRVVDSTGLLAVEVIPERLVVIGGGVIGVEFASLFAALGSQVDVVELLPEILPFMDTDIASRVRAGIEGVTFHLGCRVESLDGEPGSTTVRFTDAGGSEQALTADTVLMAVGRRPRIADSGAAEAGLDLVRGAIRVDDTMRTNLPGVWAVGDVTGRSLLAHAAYRMAEIATANILSRGRVPPGERLREDTIPWAVYAIPESAGVGLSESQAEARGLDVTSAVVPLYLSGRFVAENGVGASGAVKLVAETGSRVVRGIHMLGTYAPEMIWGAVSVLENELTIDDLRQIVFPHPTVSEGIREASWAIFS
ncbi:dihydrolipoyl dehydrogenase [Nostocoides australiense]